MILNKQKQQSHKMNEPNKTRLMNWVRQKHMAIEFRIEWWSNVRYMNRHTHTANTPMQCNFIALSRKITTTDKIVQCRLWVVFIFLVLWFPKPFFYSLKDVIRMDFMCSFFFFFFFFHFCYSHVIWCGLFSLSFIFKYSISFSCFIYLSPIIF